MNQQQQYPQQKSRPGMPLSAGSGRQVTRHPSYSSSQSSYQYRQNSAPLASSSLSNSVSVPMSTYHQPAQQPMYTQPITYAQQPPPVPVQPVPYVQQPRPQPARYHQPVPSQPTTVISRKKTVRMIPLTPQGNLVIDVPVPEKVLMMGKYRSSEEFTHMRYTAVTSSPDQFSIKGYSLRQQEYGRSTELFIVVTMYNEDDFLFCKSMTALQKNIAYLCSRSNSKTWGDSGWMKALICIVSDGRAKINARVLNVLGIMGVYQEGIMKDHVNEKPVTAHLFEYTTQVAVTTDLKVQGLDNGFVPTQILFCLKEKNAKKINSHRWFFNAFGPLIRPNVCVLIDVGTKPSQTSLYHLWKTFDKDPSVGGACGEIYAELGTGCSKLLNPLVAAQNFEYKMSNILDKPLESVMGYISVLPGAFSAYRYLALQGKPLQMYFKGETLHEGANVFAANMYLAEDRILCFEIVTKRQQGWLLKYVKAAKAETDVPDAIPEFISQRRRWLNGSFFAGVHALTHWYYIFRSGHGFGRKSILVLQFMYNFVQLFFTWFGLANFYLTFYFLGRGFPEGEGSPFYGYNKIIMEALRQIYILTMVLTVISSLGNRPQGSKIIYLFAIFMFGIIMAVMLYLSGFTIRTVVDQIDFSSGRNVFLALLQKSVFRDLFISLCATYFLYFFSSLVYFEPWHMLTSFVQYLIFLPFFMNILTTYAFCNLHDVSWGTKGDNTASALGSAHVVKGKDGKEGIEVEVPTDRNDLNANFESFVQRLREPRPSEKKSVDAQTKKEDYFRNFRTRTVLFWMFSNFILVFFLTTPGLADAIFPAQKVSSNTATASNIKNLLSFSSDFNPYLQFLFYSVIAISTIRFFGSMTYIIGYTLCGA